MEYIIRQLNSHSQDLGIVLILHNKDDDIVDVRSFQISELTFGRTFGIHEIWQMLPDAYNLVKIPGKSFPILWL